MKRFTGTVWKSYRIEAILFFLGLILTGVLICFTRRETLAPSDSIQTITLIVLVIVTVSYAVSTRRLYEVALNSERNTVFPIVSLTVDAATPDQINVSYENIGRGPALNLRIWVEAEYDEQFSFLKSDEMKNRAFRAALGVGLNGQLRWDNSEGTLPTRSSGFDIVAEYSDVFKQGFMSKLLIINPFDQEYSFGKKE